MDWRVGWRLDMSRFIKVTLSRLGSVAFFLCLITVREFWLYEVETYLRLVIIYLGMEETLGYKKCLEIGQA